MTLIKSIYFNKIKLLILLIIFYKYDFIKKLNFKLSYNYFLHTQTFYFKNYLLYHNIESCKNNSLILEEKNSILNFLYHDIGKKFNFLDNIIYSNDMQLGNSLIALNNLLFFCEIIKCKNIYLEKNKYWLIKNKIKLNNNNFTLSIKHYEYNRSNETYFKSNKLFSIKFKLRTDIRINLTFK